MRCRAGGQVIVRTTGHRVDRLGGQPTVEMSVSDTGTGLGLWMVQRFAHEAGGKVEIETSPGRGTTVRVTLPRAEDA